FLFKHIFLITGKMNLVHYYPFLETDADILLDQMIFSGKLVALYFFDVLKRVAADPVLLEKMAFTQRPGAKLLVKKVFLRVDLMIRKLKGIYRKNLFYI
ncbi:hypothetical protein ACJX0J_006706, partial [Zea mays]